MKRLSLISFMLFSFYSTYCQSLDAKTFNNKNIKFRVIKTATKLLDSNKIEMERTLVQVFIKEEVRKSAAKLTYDNWRNLLSNKNTDWAANLLLYDICKKDASTIDTSKGRKHWHECCKGKEIAYWSNFLMHKKIK